MIDETMEWEIDNYIWQHATKTNIIQYDQSLEEMVINANISRKHHMAHTRLVMLNTKVN